MATNKNGDREARAARERLRRYSARQAVHQQKVNRRKRDNLIAIIAASVVIALAVVTQVFFFVAGPGTPPPAPSPSASSEPEAGGENVGDVPDPALAEGRAWTGEIGLGDVTLGIELDGAAAPQAVAAFVQGASDGVFIDRSCHRLTDGGFFVLQCGALDAQGTGDTDFGFGPIENAPADNVYPAGTIAMARVSGDAFSNGRQFFIVYEDTTIPADAVGGYTVFGKVTSGLDQLIDQIIAGGITPGDRGANDGAPVIPTTITRLTLN